MTTRDDRRLARERTLRVVSVLAGAILVSMFLAWLGVRHHDAVRTTLGLDAGAGWISHGLAVAVLLAGLALLARGFFGRAGVRIAEDTRDTDETPT